MSEPDTPIDQNTIGGDPAPIVENEVEVVAVGLSNSTRTGREDGHDEDDNDENEDYEVDDDADDDDEEEEEEDDDDDDDFMAELPKCVRHRVEKMKDLNKKRDAIMEDYLKERAALEKKYSDLCKPLYMERADIIVGKKDEEIAQEIKDDDVDDSDDEEVDESLVGVPEFWSCCIHNIEAVSELVTERDNDCLLYLENVICEDFDDGKGFELQFYFSDNNPYFENKCLTKRYDIPNLLLDDEPILKNVSGCDIKWKVGQCLTYREVTKKQRSKSGKRAGQIRTVTKRERTDSFFHFFSPPKLPSINDMDEDEADALEEAFDHDYDVAQSFRSHIIPKGVMWFTGEAMQDEFERMMEGNVSEDGIRSQLNDMKVASGGPFPPAANGSEEPECKQS